MGIHVLSLILIWFVALLAFSAFTILNLAEAERRADSREVEGAGRSLSAAVDLHLKYVESLLTVLSASLPTGEGLASLHDKARQIAEQHDGWILLTDGQGFPIFHTQLPVGVQPRAFQTENVAVEAIRSGKPQVSHLVIGSVMQRPVFVVWVPIVREQVSYALGMAFPAETIGEAIGFRRLPAEWIVAVVDGAGTIVARNKSAQEFVGKPASAALRTQMAKADEGHHVGVTVEGTEVKNFFTRSAASQWTVAVAVPTAIAYAPLWTALRTFASGSAVVLFAGFAAAAVIGGRISRGVRAISTAALALGRREPMPAIESRIGEVAAILRCLTQASESLRASETELREQEASFRLLFEANPLPMYVCSTESLRLLAVNDAALAFYGYAQQQFLSMTLLDIRPPEEHERARAAVAGMPGVYEADRPWRHVRQDGTERQVLTYGRALEYDGSPAVIIAVVDVTERLRAEGDLRRTREFLNAVIESMPAMLLVKEPREHRFVLINKAGEELIGVSRDELLGKNDYDFFPKEQADFHVARDRDAILSGELQVIPEEPIETRHNGVRLLSTKKLAIRDEAGNPEFLLVMSEDITQRRVAERRITYLAHHDPLTGLPNRVLFREFLEEGLARVRLDRGHRLAAVYLDLDGFKNVNDTFGHTFGDQLLIEMARRLRACLREGDTVARLGGDEFAILQALAPDDDPGEAASVLASRLLARIAEPLEIDGHKVVISTSIGAAVAPSDASEPDELLKKADMALYRAKADGRATFRFFEPEMDAKMQARRRLEADLRDALAREELEVFYQPLVRISTGAVIAVEALVRWSHPERGMISPAEFIPVAEETGLIVPLGEWVLRQACAEVASWPGDIRLSVNLSPVQFKKCDVAATVASAAAAAGLAPERLEVEITETTLLQESGKILTILNELRRTGVRISMDDFGTGYSSLSYLRKYPFDKIKIDQSFVRDLPDSSESQAIVQAVTGLGAALGMVITAEGVETEEQLVLLRAAGCHEAQGYLFSRPKPAHDIKQLLLAAVAA